jgi:hypothetical protein
VTTFSQVFVNQLCKYALAMPTGWDFAPVPQDDRTRRPLYYSGPGTIGAAGGPPAPGVNEESKINPNKRWQDALKSKKERPL